jgi:hypothetical protein
MLIEIIRIADKVLPETGLPNGRHPPSLVTDFCGMLLAQRMGESAFESPPSA